MILKIVSLERQIKSKTYDHETGLIKEEKKNIRSKSDEKH